MGAPVIKVSPNASFFTQAAAAAAEAEDAIAQLSHSRIQQSLSAFGTVVSSTVPGILQSSGVYRGGIRRFASLR